MDGEICEETLFGKLQSGIGEIQFSDKRRDWIGVNGILMEEFLLALL